MRAFVENPTFIQNSPLNPRALNIVTGIFWAYRILYIISILTAYWEIFHLSLILKQHKDKARLLWANLKKGEIKALGDIYDLFIDELFTYGMQFSGDKSHVMDCIHDLFLNLYKYRKNLADTDQVGYYLLRSLKNNILKTSSKKTITLPNAHKNQRKTGYSSYEEDLIAEETNNERSYKLTKAINSLTQKQRKFLQLRFTEEHSYEEIALMMNVSVQTARTVIYRAIKTLRKQLLFILLAFILNSEFFFD